MTRAKTPPRRKAPTQIPGPRQRRRPLPRFLKALLFSSLASFGAATYMLNPQWRIPAPVQDVLARLGWTQQHQPQHPQQNSQHRQPPREQNAPAATAPIAVPTGAPAQTIFAECRQFFPNFRPPEVPGSQQLREVCFSAFAILHNGQTKTPVFVAERLNGRRWPRARTAPHRQVLRRGAPAALGTRRAGRLQGLGLFARTHGAGGRHVHPDAMAQSFSLANMVPQDQTHNGGAWSQIEQDTRKYVMRASGDVYVFTGPVYADKPRTIGSGVAVPAISTRSCTTPPPGARGCTGRPTAPAPRRAADQL